MISSVLERRDRHCVGLDLQVGAIRAGQRDLLARSLAFHVEEQQRARRAERPLCLDPIHPGSEAQRSPDLNVGAVRAWRRVAPDVGEVVGPGRGGDPEPAVEEPVVHLGRGELVRDERADVVEVSFAERDVHGDQHARGAGRGLTHRSVVGMHVAGDAALLPARRRDRRGRAPAARTRCQDSRAVNGST